MKIVAVALLALLTWLPVTWNGAGWSFVDDLFALQTTRPLLRATYEANMRLGGFMWTNVAIHAVASVAFLALTDSLPAAALFAVHPLAADAIASVSGRSSLLCGMFMLCSLAALRSGRTWAFGVLAFMAFMTKEEAVALCALVPITLFFLGRRRAALYFSLGGALLAGVLALAWRPHGVSTPRVNTAAIGAIGAHVTTNMLWPTQLSADPYPANWPLAFTLYPSMWPYAFVKLADPIFEHRAYLAIASSMFLLSLVLPKRTWVMVACAFIIISWTRCDAYSSSVKLWRDAVVKAPLAYRPHVNYGSALAAVGRKREAEQEFERAIWIKPFKQDNIARNNLASLRMYRGDMRGVEEAFDGNYR